MWTPEHFRAPSPQWEVELIDRHPFGLIISSVDGRPVATHIPMLIHPDDRERAGESLVGVHILGHLARLNPQWRDIADGDTVLLVFQGPHGYVSPTLYQDEPAAPTWNYTAVHLTGTIRLLHQRDQMMRVIDHTIDTTERHRQPPWDREPSRGYFRRIIGGIVAFDVLVSDAVSSFKLSQDQPEQRRRDVTADALGSADRDRQALGEWMRRTMS